MCQDTHLHSQESVTPFEERGAEGPKYMVETQPMKTTIPTQTSTVSESKAPSSTQGHPRSPTRVHEPSTDSRINMMTVIYMVCVHVRTICNRLW